MSDVRRLFHSMLKDIYSTLEKILTPKGVKEFEVYYERQVTRNFEVKDFSLEAAKEAVNVGVSLRVFRDDRLSFAYSTDLSSSGLQDLAHAALRILPLVDADPDYGLPRQTLPFSNEDLQNFDRSLETLSPTKKIDLAIVMEKTAKGLDPRIKHVRSASYEEQILTRALRNSHGLNCSYTKSLCSLGVMAVAEEGSEAESAYEFDFSPSFSQLDPEKVGLAAANRALSYLGSVTPTTRKVPVVLDPLVCAEILGVLVHSLQGDEVFKQRSFLKGKLGQRVYSEMLNIFDDGLMPKGVGSSPFDGEGQPHQRIVLVEGGVLNNFLLDTYYARKLGMKNNAAAGRHGIKRAPGISYSNLFIQAGALSDEQIYQKIGAGVLVTDAIGMHAANPITGDFSVGIQGFLIEGGEITRPIKKVAIAGNLHQMMGEVVAVGLHHRYNFNIGAPTLAIREMALSGA
jgi:PmbA protein